MKSFEIRQISQEVAWLFIDTYHRHHKHPHKCLFNVGAFHRDQLIGVATIGDPVSRILAARGYLEVSRTCTIAWGINRELYKWAALMAKEKGRPICTYTWTREHGRSLIHAGWKIVHYRKGYSSDWNSPARYRNKVHFRTRARWEPVVQSAI